MGLWASALGTHPSPPQQGEGRWRTSLVGSLSWMRKPQTEHRKRGYYTRYPLPWGKRLGGFQWSASPQGLDLTALHTWLS